MARYLSAQYPNKNSPHQRKSKEGKSNGKKGDDPEFEDKDKNTTCTVGANIGDTTTPEKSTAPSGGVSIGAYVLEVNEQSSRPARSIKEIVGAHPIGDEFWGRTNPSDVSIDIANSEEVMAGSHIIEQHTFKFRGSVQPELLNMTPYEAHTCDLYPTHPWKKTIQEASTHLMFTIVFSTSQQSNKKEHQRQELPVNCLN